MSDVSRSLNKTLNKNLNKLAIIIGFQYEQDEPTEYDPAMRGQLPGIIIDIYQAVTQARIANFDRVIVITDLYNDERTTLVNNALNDGVVDIDILEILKSLKENNEYYYYNSKDTMINLIRDTIPDYNRIFLYYTGHAFRGYILLPRHRLKISTIDNQTIPCIDDDRWKIVDVKDMIHELTVESLQSIIVMDCCNGNGMNLPFILKGNDFRLNDNLLEQWNFNKQQIICFSSAMFDEDSQAGTDGSTFSLQFFGLLRDSLSNDHRIISHDLSLPYFLTVIQNNCLTQYDQTAMIHVSHPIIVSIWAWLIRDTNIQVTVNSVNLKISIDSFT